ncbi:hypothetical protein HDE_04257 [Halotydeus destructor]|nr:hypothetical protein HDE_04257 [Halotydeus destructor]
MPYDGWSYGDLAQLLAEHPRLTYKLRLHDILLTDWRAAERLVASDRLVALDLGVPDAVAFPLMRLCSKNISVSLSNNELRRQAEHSQEFRNVQKVQIKGDIVEVGPVFRIFPRLVQLELFNVDCVSLDEPWLRTYVFPELGRDQPLDDVLEEDLEDVQDLELLEALLGEKDDFSPDLPKLKPLGSLLQYLL